MKIFVERKKRRVGELLDLKVARLDSETMIMILAIAFYISL